MPRSEFNPGKKENGLIYDLKFYDPFPLIINFKTMLIKRLIFFPLFSFSIFAEEQPSRTTKDQGRLPVFVNSGSTHEMSNFKAHLSYKSVNGNTLLFSSGHSIELPEGEHTLSVVYENHESENFT